VLLSFLDWAMTITGPQASPLSWIEGTEKGVFTTIQTGDRTSKKINWWIHVRGTNCIDYP